MLILIKINVGQLAGSKKSNNTTSNTYETPLSFRFHSFYPWHTSGDYNFLCDQKDMGMLKWIREFNQFDLYTKCPDIPDVDELIPYYTKIVEKYVPGKLKW